MTTPHSTEQPAPVPVAPSQSGEEQLRKPSREQYEAEVAHRDALNRLIAWHRADASLERLKRGARVPGDETTTPLPPEIEAWVQEWGNSRDDTLDALLHGIVERMEKRAVPVASSLSVEEAWRVYEADAVTQHGIGSAILRTGFDAGWRARDELQRSAPSQPVEEARTNLLNLMAQIGPNAPDDAKYVDALIEAVREEQATRIVRLRTATERCEVACEAFHWGGSCRCSELFNELPAANARAEAAEQREAELRAALTRILRVASILATGASIAPVLFEQRNLVRKIARAALGDVAGGER